MIEKIDLSIRASFSRVKSELDNHLDSINENTHEINANFEHILRLESKLDKLSERIDELSMIFSAIKGEKKVDERKFEDIKLTIREQEIFLSIYLSDAPLTHFEIARKLGLTVELVENYIESMISKGVPILKEYNGNKVMFGLEDEFRALQAKSNVLKINEKVSQIF